jgi:hypothetical protein
MKIKLECGEGNSRAGQIINRASSFVGEIIRGKSSTVKDAQDRLDLIAKYLQQAIKFVVLESPEIEDKLFARRETSLALSSQV